MAALHNATRGHDIKNNTIAKGTLPRIVRFTAAHRPMMLAFLVVSIVVSTLGVITPVLAGHVINAITGGGPTSTIIQLATLIAIVAIATATLNILNRWLSATIGENLILDLRTAVYDHVQKLPIAFFTRTRTGALVSRLNNDVIGAQRAFSNTLSGAVSNLVSVLLTIGVMVTISWQVTLLSLLLLPIFLIPARLVGRRLATLQRQAAQYNAEMSTHMTERFSAGGATLIKLFGNPTAESAEFAQRAGRVRTIGVHVAMLQTTFVTALTLVSALALALVYGVGGVQAIVGNLDAGQVVTLAMLLSQLYTPLTMLANARLDIMSALVSFERVFEVLDLKPLITEPQNPQPIPDGPVTLQFDNVSFTYPTAEEVSLASLEDVSVLENHPNEQVLHGIDFTITPGQTVALVGSSGAGKSTIASLVPRLYDTTQGSVRLAGIDIKNVSSEQLRHTIGMVTQDGDLFHESIRANMTLVRPNATENDIWSALQRARMDHVIKDLPDGLETVIGERGYRLSGGERQRLTIARLLLAAPRIVILDEATSALDSTSEAHVQAALDEVMDGRTALVIAHRLSTVRKADRILVIENGTIIESGSHQQLLAAGGRYTELYRTQFAEQE